MPKHLELQAVPNPFNPRTELRFTTARDGHLRLDIFDARGRRVSSLLDGQWPQGAHRVVWNGCDEDGIAASSGVFFARLMAGEESQVIKLLLLR